MLLLSFCRPASGEPPQGPVAVVALVTEADEEVLARLAAALQAELIASERIVVLPAEKTAMLLSGGARPIYAGEDLDRLKGLFQQGYLQSYSFRYQRALNTLQRVIEGLDRLPAGEERWRLWIKTKIFQGICLAGLKNESAALKAFAEVLRTRPGMKLSRREYSPKVIALWNKARRRLSGLEKGRLTVQSDPADAVVFLDGQQVGKTPYIGSFPFGHYHLGVRHPKTGGAERSIRISERPVRIRVQLSFEGALVFDRAHPCVRLPAGEESLPEHWWPWLGDRLGLRHLIVVRRHKEGRREYLASALVDLETGRRLREGMLEAAEDESSVRRHASDLADFLITGRAAPRITVRALPPAPEAAPPAGERMPDLPVHFASRPWYWKWWPYAAAGGAFLALGVGSHLASDYYSRRVGEMSTTAAREDARDKSDAWLGMAVTGYVLAGGTALTGLILHLCYQPEEIFPASAVLPVAGPDGVGIVWTLRY